MLRKAVLFAAALSLTLGGCDKIKEKMAEKAAEKATGGEVDIDSKTGQVRMKQKGPDGKETEVQLGKNTSIPADFPKAVPIYPGAKVIAAVSISQGEGGHMVTLTTDDSVEQVSEYYKKNLTGFKVDGQMSAGDTTILTMSSAELTVSVSATKSSTENNTAIQLTASKRKS
jgi:pentose-5-phosphate-3-epimerase